MLSQGGIADLRILHRESGAKSSNRQSFPSPILGRGARGEEGILNDKFAGTLESFSTRHKEIKCPNESALLGA
jgi:hypothetical protein